MAQGQGALLGTYPGLANQFVTSHAAMRQMQETMMQEQNLFISLLGAVWRRVITIIAIIILIIVIKIIIILLIIIIIVIEIKNAFFQS